MKIIDKLAWIEIKNKQILSTRSFGKDKYYIPGGKRELGESDNEALIREIKEELSVDLIESSIRLVGVFESQAHGQAEGVIVKMTCYKADYVGEIKNAAEIEEIKWLNFTDKELTSYVDIVIFDYLREKGEM